MLTSPDLPEPGEQSLDDRRRISRRFMIHAREELKNGNRMQAGEKAWGAVVQPLKAIAEQRGWHHQSHQDIHNVGLQILAESPNVDLQEALSAAYRVGHENFYENHRHPEELAEMLDKVEDECRYCSRCWTPHRARSRLPAIPSCGVCGRLPAMTVCNLATRLRSVSR